MNQSPKQESPFLGTISLIDINKGGNHTNGHETYIHPKLAIQLAQWLSPKFALQELSKKQGFLDNSSC